MDSQNSNQIAQIPSEIKTFLESILQDANMTSLDEQTHEEMIKQLFIRLDNFMLTTIVEALPAEKISEFTKLSEEGKTREELENYLRKNIPNHSDVFAKAMLQFRDLYLGNVAVARNTPSA